MGLKSRVAMALGAISLGAAVALSGCSAITSNEDVPIVQEADSLGLTGASDGVAAEGQNLYVRLACDQDGYDWVETVDGEELVLGDGPVIVESGDEKSAVFLFLGQGAGEATVHLSYTNGSEEANSCTVTVELGEGGQVLSATYQMADGQTGAAAVQ